MSAKSLSKTQGDRRVARERSFRSYFDQSIQIKLDLGNIIFQRSLIFTGKVLDDPKFLYSEKTPDGLLAVSEQFSNGYKEGYRIIPKGFEQNLLCGVADRRNRCLGLGIIKEIDFAGRRICLLTPVSEQRIRVIQFGDSYISPEGYEIGRRRPGSF
jgi:polynucleotide 5'-hydroxyl-kinase GRC3/NOL9